MTNTPSLRKLRALLLTTTIAIGLTTVSVFDSASAGFSGIEVNYQVFGPDFAAVGDALTLELFDSNGALVPGCNSSVGNGSGTRLLSCNTGVLSNGQTYTLGVDTVDAAYFVSYASCSQSDREMLDTSDFPDAVVAFNGGFESCQVQISQTPTLYIDKVTTGGPLGASDFTLEIYDDSGALVPITPAVVDPDDALCTIPITNGLQESADSLLDPSICAAIVLEPGSYTMGEILPDYGYDESSLSCVSTSPVIVEILPSPAFDFTHGEFGSDTLCTLTNDYITQVVTADIVVENDSGGTATGADFTIEVFQAGSLVASGVDPAPNDPTASFVSDPLPIGDYTFGISGPEGYETTIDVTIEEVDVATEQLPSPAADFTLSRTQTAAALLTVNDPLQATTTTSTTTTTTVAPTTTTTTVAPSTAPAATDAPTTAAPTTAAPVTTVRPTTQLPATGSTSSTLLLLGLALFALGSGTILTARRS